MINDHVKLSKLIRKCTKNVWHKASYHGINFNYRFISVCDLEHWNGYLGSAKVNLEVEVTESRFSNRTWDSSITERENRLIRQVFYYQEDTNLKTMLKFFSIDTSRLTIKSIKRKNDKGPSK